MNTCRRLARHLSFANVVACMALFVALGGGAYAATSKINGNSIKQESIGGGKLKKETITSKQIKKGTLTSSVIDVSSLTTVPSAQTAVTATSATTATSAKSAESAKTADSATTANTATKATSADSAAHANSADTAGHADTATSADHADSAGDAATLDGETAAQLTVSCQSGTEFFGGICWDTNEQPTRTWFEAIEECSERGGRLPTIGELIAYALRPAPHQVESENWSGDIESLGAKELVFTSDDASRHTREATLANNFAYRCVFYPEQPSP